jgi:pilus assembly protein CpaC
MKAGQTFALAGLVQERTFTTNTGVPYLSDLPILGVPFRKTTNDVEEIELLVMVTPEFVDPLDQHEVPCGGPGTYTTSPDNRDLYCGGHVEVPLHCNPISGMSACGDVPCGTNGCAGCQPYGSGGPFGGGMPMTTGGLQLPGGVGYDESYGPTLATPDATGGQYRVPSLPAGTPETLPEAAGQPMSVGPDDMQLPNAAPASSGVWQGNFPAMPADASQLPQPSAALPQYTAPRPYSPLRQPVFTRNASKPDNLPSSGGGAAATLGETGLLGPVGYEPQ